MLPTIMRWTEALLRTSRMATQHACVQCLDPCTCVAQATNADHLLHRVRELEADVAELQEALSAAQTNAAEKDQQLT